MYLGEFKTNGARLQAQYEHLVDITDQTLTSDKAAYDLFERIKKVAKTSKDVPNTLFMQFRRLVYKIEQVSSAVCNIETSYPIEAITYRVLTIWLDAETQSK